MCQVVHIGPGGLFQRWKKSKPFLGSLIQGELLSAKRGNSIAKIGQTEVCAPFAEREIPRGISLKTTLVLFLTENISFSQIQ